MYSPPSFAPLRISPSLLRKEGEITRYSVSYAPSLRIREGVGVSSLK